MRYGTVNSPKPAQDRKTERARKPMKDMTVPGVWNLYCPNGTGSIFGMPVKSLPRDNEDKSFRI